MEKQFPVYSVINQQGELLDSKDAQRITAQLAQQLYRAMLRIRTFDRQAIHLQRQGRLGTYAPFEGQEASQVGSAMALQENDWLFPTYRDHGASLTFGADMVKTYLYWNGHMEGAVLSKEKRIFPPAVPIATQLPHATGAAWAEKQKGTKNAAIAYFGDGATSEGDFHEGMNFASVFQVPVVFFNQNNGYAISVPIDKQMHSKTIAQKALAYGMPSVRVDGNDCFAVYFAVQQALENARQGNGPTLIEAVTWRTGAHTTADDPSKYRNEQEGVNYSDPIARLKSFMEQYGYWDETVAQQMAEEINDEISQAVAAMEAYPAPPLALLFDHVFATMPASLAQQKEKLLRSVEGGNAQ